VCGRALLSTKSLRYFWAIIGCFWFKTRFKSINCCWWCSVLFDSATYNTRRLSYAIKYTIKPYLDVAF